MRICPTCGHVDPMCWRPNAWNPQYSYARIDQLEFFVPELWQLIKDKKPGEIVQLGEYLYWKTQGGSQTVRRCWIEDFKIVGKKGEPQERVDHSALAMVKPLTDFVRKAEE